MSRSSALAKPATYVFPSLSNSPEVSAQPPKKKVPQNIPPLTTLATFSSSNTALPLPKPKVTQKPTLSTKSKSGHRAEKAVSLGKTAADRVLISKMKKTERKAMVLRTPPSSLQSMTEVEFRIHLDAKICAIFEALLGHSESKTKIACLQTLTIQNQEKFWTSTLLFREIDRMWFVWILKVVDPCVVWTPPFNHTTEWRTYLQAQVVNKEFIFHGKVKGDLARIWSVGRDRRDVLDQKKLRFARSCAKSYQTALASIRQACLTEFVALKDFTPESAFFIFMRKIITSTGFARCMKNWLGQYAIAINDKGLLALHSILEGAILKTGKDVREDFSGIYRQAVNIRKSQQEEECFVSQPPSQFDWTML